MVQISKIYGRERVVNDMGKNKLISIMFGVYCSSLIIQNILAAKTIDVAIFTVTTGVLISPLVFIVQDISCELFGYKQTKRMILLSFLMNFIAVILFQLAIMLPASETYANQEAFGAILGTTLRIAFASFLAYVTGSLINAKVMVALKKGKANLFKRAITSTLAGQLCDNAVFSIAAFAFVLPVPAIVSMIIGATLFEVIYEIVFYPITKAAIKKAGVWLND